MGATVRDTVNIVVGVPRLDLAVQSNNINLYPNPVTDMATLEINAAQSNSKLLAVITSMLGKIVYTENFISSGQNNIKEIINMSNLAKGSLCGNSLFR